MKRRITIDQLQELSDEQKKKLVEWWEPKNGDITVNERNKEEALCGWLGGTSCYIKNDLVPLVDIGQMIELLQNNNGFIKDCDSGEFMRTSNWVILDYLPGVELCDELWQAVKEVL